MTSLATATVIDDIEDSEFHCTREFKENPASDAPDASDAQILCNREASVNVRWCRHGSVATGPRKWIQRWAS